MRLQLDDESEGGTGSAHRPVVTGRASPSATGPAAHGCTQQRDNGHDARDRQQCDDDEHGRVGIRL
jgi:hypothetical protein